MKQLFSNKIAYSLLLFLILTLGFSQNKEIKNDSINILTQKVSDKSLPLLKRLEFNNRIYKSTQNDSLVDFALSKYVYLYYKLNDSLNFPKYANKYLEFARKSNNDKAVAKTLEYKAAYFNKDNVIDSTFYYYYKSFKAYDKNKDSLSAGKILLNIAILQKNIRDYSGSESTSLRALDFLKSTNNDRRISSVYNNLGIIYSHLDRYDKSLEFHKKALGIRTKLINNSIYKIQSLNNVGKVYIDKNNNKKAIEYLVRASNYNSLLNKNLKTKSAIIDNLAYARYKDGIQLNVLNDFNKALLIQDSIGDKYGSIKSLLHLAEYYKSIDSTKKAIVYTEKAEKIAQQIARNQEYLDALGLIAELYDGKASKRKLKRYVFVRDSLDSRTHKQKEVFASIQLGLKEKDTLIAHEKKSNKKKYYWILVLTFIIIISLYAYYILYLKRQKQKKELSKQLKEKDDELTDSKLQLNTMKSFGLKEHDKDYLYELKKTLRIKYNLSKQNLEFWNVFIKDLTQIEQAERLDITKTTLIKRRKSLKRKIQIKRPITGDFTSKIAKRIYQDEEELFKNTYTKK